jgi:hypothetical protein
MVQVAQFDYYGHRYTVFQRDTHPRYKVVRESMKTGRSEERDTDDESAVDNCDNSEIVKVLEDKNDMPFLRSLLEKRRLSRKSIRKLFE